MKVKLLGEKEDQMKQETVLRDTAKELKQQHSDAMVIFHTVSRSIMHASQTNRIHFEGIIAVEC